MTRVAFVGLGAMGLPMASNLLSNGFAVTGYDLNATALDALESAGGQRATDAASAASGADILILMVVNAAQAEAVLFEGGALEALRPDGVVALMATCPPSAVGTINDRVLKAGRRLIDSPVSGGVAGAKAATLTIMAAAPKDTFDRAKPAFDALGDKVFHVGENPGQGAMVKTVNQLLCGVHIAVVAEAFASGREGRRRPQDPAGDHERFFRVELDAQGPGAAHAGGRARGDERGGHLRQGSRHRAGCRPGREGSAALGCGSPADVPCHFRTRRRIGG